MTIPQQQAYAPAPNGQAPVLPARRPKGISLTVFGIHGPRFCCELIPHTLKVTTLGFKRAGDAVNFESDMLVKYVEKMLAERGMLAAAGGS